MVYALGIASTQSAGLREMFGSMCKNLHIGRAAQNGLTSALFAKNGFTSSTQSLETWLLDTPLMPIALTRSSTERVEMPLM